MVLSEFMRCPIRLTMEEWALWDVYCTRYPVHQVSKYKYQEKPVKLDFVPGLLGAPVLCFVYILVS